MSLLDSVAWIRHFFLVSVYFFDRVINLELFIHLQEVFKAAPASKLSVSLLRSWQRPSYRRSSTWLAG